MFISYKINDTNELTNNSDYGYMVFRKDALEKLKLPEVQAYLDERLWRQNPEILHIIRFNQDAKKYYVWMSTDGVHRTIEYDGELKDVEDVGTLYSFLHNKYGFTNILGFIPIP